MEVNKKVETLVKGIKDLKVSLIIPTGRPQVKKVVKSFLDNAEYHGYDLKNFSVYLAIDTSFQDAKLKDFMFDESIEKKISRVVYISEEDRVELSKKFKGSDCNEKFLNLIFSNYGHSRQRNSALFCAAIDGNDVAIGIDDDESPCIPVKDGKKIKWKNMDFFTPHLKELIQGCDITSGSYTGYISPIPSNLSEKVPENIRKNLGKAFSYGNDVTNENTFIGEINKPILLDSKDIDKFPYDVVKGKYGKHLYGGNMGINLHSLKKGRIPVFYTAPGSRGDDSIFAFHLRETSVKKVGSFIFHDPFSKYSCVFDKKFPNKLEDIRLDEGTLKRFARCIIGRLKYAPLLIHLSSKDVTEREELMIKMIALIEKSTGEMALALDCPELNNCTNILLEFSSEVDQHYSDLTNVQSEWKNSVINFIK